MASCTEQDVRDRIQTELASAVVTRLITEADDELTDMIGSGSLDAGQKKRACALLTCEIIAMRYPQSYKVGGLSVTNPQDYAKQFRRGAIKILRRSSGVGGMRAVDPLAED